MAEEEVGGTPLQGTPSNHIAGYSAVPARMIRTDLDAAPVPVGKQGPNTQSIVASGMSVERWKAKHPTVPLGPEPEDVGQLVTDPPDGSLPEKPDPELLVIHKDTIPLTGIQSGNMYKEDAEAEGLPAGPGTTYPNEQSVSASDPVAPA